MSEDNRETTDNAMLSESASIEVTPAQETAMQAEPEEIARGYRLQRIERAARALLEGSGSQAVSMALMDLRIAYYSPPMPPPDEPRLTRMELITLAEDAEQYLLESAHLDDYARNKRTRAESRAAIAKAREIIGRGEDRLYPERFMLEPEERDMWEVNPEEGNAPALTWEELATLADIADGYIYPEHAKPIDKEEARLAANRARDNIARILYEQEHKP